MKPIILLCLFVAGSMANGYGSVSISYGQNTPPVVSYGPAAAPKQLRTEYSAPAPAAPVRSYAAPVPAAPVRPSYSAPAPAAPVLSYAAPATPVRSTYSAPATPVRSSYSAPAPAAPVRSSYSAPAPAAPVRSSYSAPAPATPVLSYAAPAPAAPVLSYSAPASPTYGSSYGSPAVEQIPITKYTQDMQEGSHHRVSFETGHGIRHDEHTQIRMNPNAVGTSEDALAGRAIVTKTGSFHYMAPEGHPISTEYNAGENGYEARGQHLPVAPSDTEEVAQAKREFFATYEQVARERAAQSVEAPQGNSYGGGYAAPATPAFRPPVASPPFFRSPY